MLSSSASRREAAAARATKNGELPKSAAAVAWKDVAATARSGELSKAVTGAELSKAVAAVRDAAAVQHEGWMVRYGRRKIGRSFFHTRYFVLESRLLAYYKKKPKDNMVPLKSLLIDGNCRVEDRGLKNHHGQMIYVLCVYNQKEKEHQITMGAHDIEDALAWKKKIELLIDQNFFPFFQQPDSAVKTHKSFATIDFDMDLGGQFSLSDHDSAAEDEEERPTLVRRTTIGNGPPDSIHDWTKDADFGLRIYEELLEVEYLARSCSRAMRAVGVVEATCEAIFGLMMSMDATRYEWDCSFRQGSLVEEVDGHTAVLYHRLQLHWCPRLIWPRDLCYVRYWRRNDDGSYVVLFRSTEHPNCIRQRGFVRAFIERLREYFSQTDDIHITPRIPAMESMADEITNKSDNEAKHTDEPPEKIDLSCFSGILHHDPDEKSRNCWTVPDSKLFKVRSKNFPNDKSKIPAASYLMELAAIDWFKDTKRMDNVGRQKNCVAQVAAEKGMHTFIVNLQIPGSTHYSMVMYFVTSSLKKGSLLQRFFDGDDDFRNSRLKLIPSVPKGSWIVRQSVGSTPCLLGKAVDCNYFRSPGYLEVDVDIGSSAVANGVLGLVFGVVTTLVVDMAFLIQANTYEELPEQVIGAARLSNVEPSTAVVPDLENNSDGNKDNSSNDATSSEDDSSKKTN
ncbi:Protein ENHANCED DISEASE RESISTANCE 2 [Zea mays]|uniref:Protein ENHANCED DISEASE RESISTANCE 2 n=1 Tax=Zea mays TaxID=4577 RepID=A0A1D6F3P5_MAIZE|nr:Protein ENHANCED DISEASE RESISTANCE 2 [Zea mays]ONM25962.1 Protein ENHANCED DISEASE RESISTANCE 2 [Zea mays]